MITKIKRNDLPNIVNVFYANGSIRSGININNPILQDAISGTGDYKGNPITIEDEFTTDEIETQIKASITAKADSIIYTKYPQIKQNKMFQQIANLQQKKIEFLSDNANPDLTTEELNKIAELKIAEAWITAIRTIENTAIADGTLLADIDWTVV